MIKMLIALLATVFVLPALGMAGNHMSKKLKEQIALVINVRGYLCAEVIEVRPLRLADTYEVTCIEFRG
ncbi:hypothetical protein JYT78_00230, partial [bacterium AH-315-I20]|nr:hypothetical protein [bacterium AH-315-I20]